MDVDAAQYASISRELLERGSFLQVIHRGENYLDKPPLLFWLSDLSFKLLGISSFSYKLPSFLFTVLGVYSTYRIAKILYNNETGVFAALILYTSQAYFLFSNDVRTDALLTANVAFSTWQLLQFSYAKKWFNLLLGFSGVAFAMMAKGPIGAIVPAAALVAHLVYLRDWKTLFWWHWIAGMAFTFLLLLPMLYGLYGQYGLTGFSFFFWTQSFGRITGENVWHNEAGYFYFFHNFFWSFLPWAFVAAFSICMRLYQLFSTKFIKSGISEALSLGGFVLPFIALSFSHYKLPHYAFVVYPFCAIITAGCISEGLKHNVAILRFFRYIQIPVIVFLLAAAGILATYFFPAHNIFLMSVFIILTVITILFFFLSPSLIFKSLFSSAAAAIALNFMLNSHIYPSLLKYQGGSELAAVALKLKVPADHLYFYNSSSHSFEFYFRNIVPFISKKEIINKSFPTPVWIIGGDDLISMLKAQHITPKQVIWKDDFPVTRLTLKFLNPQTRKLQLKKRYLMEL